MRSPLRGSLLVPLALEYERSASIFPVRSSRSPPRSCLIGPPSREQSGQPSVREQPRRRCVAGRSLQIPPGRVDPWRARRPGGCVANAACAIPPGRRSRRASSRRERSAPPSAKSRLTRTASAARTEAGTQSSTPTDRVSSPRTLRPSPSAASAESGSIARPDVSTMTRSAVLRRRARPMSSSWVDDDMEASRRSGRLYRRELIERADPKRVARDERHRRPPPACVPRASPRSSSCRRRQDRRARHVATVPHQRGRPRRGVTSEPSAHRRASPGAVGAMTRFATARASAEAPAPSTPRDANRGARAHRRAPGATSSSSTAARSVAISARSSAGTRGRASERSARASPRSSVRSRASSSLTPSVGLFGSVSASS